MSTHTQMLTQTVRRVINARGRLLLDQPFFGVLALRLTVLEDPTCDTAWTDGRSIGFNPAFVATLTDDALMGLLAHEVMHCACGHPWRRDGRDHQQWNIAADHAINHVLRDAHFTLPDGALIDPAYAGRNAEWIYDRLPQSQPQAQSGSQSGQNGTQAPNGNGSNAPAPQPGEVRDAPADAAVDATTEADWKTATEQAKKTARGSLTGSARESLTAAAHTSVDWRSLLQRYLTDITAADYTWTRPSARYLQSGLYLPSLRSPGCGALVVAIDTSGSIDTVLLQQFMSEIRELARTLQPSTVHVMQCDTRVHHTDCFDRGDDVVIGEIYGRGGTSFAPVFAAVDDYAIDPMCLIYLTDLDGRFPDVEPSYPVLWCAYGRGAQQTAPFGEVIPCE